MKLHLFVSNGRRHFQNSTIQGAIVTRRAPRNGDVFRIHRLHRPAVRKFKAGRAPSNCMRARINSAHKPLPLSITRGPGVNDPMKD